MLEVEGSAGTQRSQQRRKRRRGGKGYAGVWEKGGGSSTYGRFRLFILPLEIVRTGVGFHNRGSIMKRMRVGAWRRASGSRRVALPIHMVQEAAFRALSCESGARSKRKCFRWPKWLLKKHITAAESYNRWWVPPAAIGTHLSIGSVYAWSILYVCELW